MKRCLEMTSALLAMLLSLQGCRREMSVTDFGAIPSDGNDDTEALRKAAAWVRETPGATLIFPEGEYLIRDDYAEQVERSQHEDFVPYHKYSKGLDFEGSKDATVKGYGATILVSGWMETVTIENCDNFRLEGLTLRHVRKPASEGTVTRIEPDCFYARMYCTPFPLTVGERPKRCCIYDEQNECIYSDVLYGCHGEAVSADEVRFDHSIPERLLGAKVFMQHCFHYRPQVWIGESRGVTLQDVTINDGNGMGITGWHSCDILMRRLAIVPAEGLFYSTNTDATHFSSCYGTIEFDHCTFIGQGDDATNVHGYYQDILSTDGNNAEIKFNFAGQIHSLRADVPRIGDEFALVGRADLMTRDTYKVTAFTHEENSEVVGITLDRPLPDGCTEDCYLINTTLMPRLKFHHCTCERNIARGILVKTDKGTEIDHCTFNGMNIAGVVLSSEGNWKEGWQTVDADIHHNTFINNGGTGDYEGSSIALDIKCDARDSVILHRNIRIHDNTIVSNAGNACGILVRNAEDVTIENNKISGCVDEVHVHCSNNVRY